MRRPPLGSFFAIFLLLFLFSPLQVRGQTTAGATYDAAKNFSASANPAGAWSYGYREAGGPFTLYASRTNFFGASTSSWQKVASACCPMVTKNNSGTTYTYQYAPLIVHHPAFLNLHPGPAGERSVVRWTAPASGTYKVLGQFEGMDAGGTTTDVRVTHNSAVLFSGSVNSFGAAAPFLLTVKAAAGDAVEFSVGVGSNGNDTHDSTGLYATISPVPPPPAAVTTTDNLVRVNFDNVAAGSLVTDQYRPHVTFSPNGFSAGPSWPALLAHDVRAQPAAVFGGSSPNAIASLWNNCPPGPACANGEVFLDFVTVPVNKFSFSILNSRSGGHLCYIDVWIDYFYSGTYEVFGTAQPFTPIFVDLRNLNRVTGVRIRQVQNFHGPYITNTYYDDFSFAPDISLTITNPRVGGPLQGTTQKALLGADVSLQVSANRSGGTYSWTIAGPHQRVNTSTNHNAVVARWTEPGTYRAAANYTLNGITVTSYVDVDVVVPTLSSFTGEQAADRVSDGSDCEGVFTPPGPAYVAGCPAITLSVDAPPPNHFPGVKFAASAQIPAGQYLSDPAQSGIKFVQIVNTQRKFLAWGDTWCWGTRNRQPAPEWMVDTVDPYGGVRLFSTGNSLTTREEDSPQRTLVTTPVPSDASQYTSLDAFSVDERFEVYVVYFTGSNPGAPIFQRAIGFPNPTNDPNKKTAYLPWRWGGEVRFGPKIEFLVACPSDKYKLGYCLKSNTPTGPVPALSKAAMTQYSGTLRASTPYTRCTSITSADTRMIDVPRFFVRQHYLDFLKRDPLTPLDPGLGFWRADITQCGFDTGCVEGMRVNVSKAFFFAAEFTRNIPALALSNKGTDSYNREFVRQCYYNYLRRTQDPAVADPAGFTFWVNKLNSQYPVIGEGAYNEMIRAFISSIEYRNRFPLTPPFRTPPSGI